jgi:hypothetical protein
VAVACCWSACNKAKVSKYVKFHGRWAAQSVAHVWDREGSQNGRLSLLKLEVEVEVDCRLANLDCCTSHTGLGGDRSHKQNRERGQEMCLSLSVPAKSEA